MRSTILLALLLASCTTTQERPHSGGAAPITHEPYGSEMKEFKTHPPAEQVWKPGPPSLPSGAQFTVLEGDPTKEGPFVFRVKVPDGYTIPPHMHPRAERVTVIQGTFHIAEGRSIAQTRDAGKGRVMPAGSFGYWPARMPHVAWVKGETIAQFHGQGPWLIEYLNPQDDPRNAGKQ
jgi:quercetin dioxygenase-like cupin family protein